MTSRYPERNAGFVGADRDAHSRTNMGTEASNLCSIADVFPEAKSDFGKTILQQHRINTQEVW